MSAVFRPGLHPLFPESEQRWSCWRTGAQEVQLVSRPGISHTCCRFAQVCVISLLPLSVVSCRTPGCQQTPTRAPNTSCTLSWPHAEGWESGPLLVTGCGCSWGTQPGPAGCVQPRRDWHSGHSRAAQGSGAGPRGTSPQPCHQPGARRQTSHIRHAPSFNKDTSKRQLWEHTGASQGQERELGSSQCPARDVCAC